jgi:type I restriction enzyme M protein
MKILHCDHSKAYPQFLYHIIQNIKFPFTDHKRYWISQYSKIKIPLPPLDIQQLIVDELDGYQKIIDGAKQVVDNYKPTIEIDESWEIVELGEVCKLL